MLTDTRVVHLKLVNRESVVRFEYSADGKQWTRHPWQMEVSGFHHNVFGGFLSLKIGLFAPGRGEVRARAFRYRGLDMVFDADNARSVPTWPGAFPSRPWHRSPCRP